MKKGGLFLDIKLSPCSEFYIFWGDSPDFEFYFPTFRYTLYQLHRRCKQEEGTDSVPKRCK